VPVGPASLTLAGRVVIVTGAAKGLGHAIAVTCARLGADVAVCDRDGDALSATTAAVEALGQQVVAAVLDVRDASAVETFVASAAELGPVDVLVHNAGGGFAASFLDVTEKGEAALIAENFTSVTNLTRLVVPRMPAAGASIVIVTSIEAHRAGPGYAVYSAMKAALASLTKSLALEFGARGIRVNAVAPDVIPTPGVGDLQVDTPIAGPGHPDDVAGAVAFLTSDLARFITGTTLHVDGGTHAAGGWRRVDGRWTPS
jgi:NAD(P)-dependent dehydrogenase (short-subunit alcohol dehydrogenase family)